MSPADVRLTAQLVVDKRVHCVSDEAVEAMARRVLELEAHVAAEREACAKLVGDYVDLASGNRVRTDFAKAIRARGAQGATIAGVSEGNDG